MTELNVHTLTLYTYRAVCTNVVDGDTVDLVIDMGFRNSSERRIRLANIDTPERGQEGFQEAKEYMVEMLLGKECFVQSYKSGTFGRWIGDLFLELSDGTLMNINQHMLDTELAVPYTGRT